MANKLVKTSALSGWNAGGVTYGTQAGDLIAQFTLVAGSAGIVAGLAPSMSAPAYSSVEHGVLAQAGQEIQIIEAGAIKASTGIVFTTSVIVQIYRVGTSVYYLVGAFPYSSETPSSGTKAIQAVLFAAGDAVDSPSLASYSSDISQAVLSDTISFVDGLGYEPHVFGEMSSTITLTSDGAGQITILAGMEDFITFLDGAGVDLIILAGMESKITFTDGAGASSQAMLQYATNLATGAVTRYEGFTFDGFCRVGMNTYAFRKEGLYLVESTSDDGAPITAQIDFPAEDFGSTQGKRIGNLFLGLQTDGYVYARTVEDSGQEMNGTAYRRRSEMRADFGRGRASRHWRLRLDIVEASTAELDNIEWVVVATGRRT